MQLRPRYDTGSVLRLDLPVGDPAEPLLRQRRRLGVALEALDEEQWRAPSRCDQWCVRDVVAHLVTTNQFWALSIGAALQGAPTRFLATFDPVATPAQLVDGMRAKSSAEVLDGYVESLDALAEIVTSCDETSWSLPGEAPPGHIPLSGVALHALWDAWIHERDILLPLGITPVEEADEIVGCLTYAAAIGPMLRSADAAPRSGSFGVIASDPDVALTVTLGDTVVVTAGAPAGKVPILRGDAVALVDGLTFRAPLAHDLGPDEVWMLSGLDEVFDRPAAPS